jgi:hypothetical protein
MALGNHRCFGACPLCARRRTVDIPSESVLTLSGHTQRRIAIAALDFWRFQACAASDRVLVAAALPSSVMNSRRRM